jgi:hypothetical protein
MISNYQKRLRRRQRIYNVIEAVFGAVMLAILIGTIYLVGCLFS